MIEKKMSPFEAAKTSIKQKKLKKKKLEHTFVQQESYMKIEDVVSFMIYLAGSF